MKPAKPAPETTTIGMRVTTKQKDAIDRSARRAKMTAKGLILFALRRLKVKV
jgi:hypothetical protein